MSTSRWFKVRRKDGSLLDAVEIQSAIRTGSLDDPSETIPGLSSFKLKDGRALNRLKMGTFVIVGTGEELIAD